MRSLALLILALVVACLMLISGPLSDFLFGAGMFVLCALVFGAIVALAGGAQCNP